MRLHGPSGLPRVSGKGIGGAGPQWGRPYSVGTPGGTGVPLDIVGEEFGIWGSEGAVGDLQGYSQAFGGVQEYCEPMAISWDIVGADGVHRPTRDFPGWREMRGTVGHLRNCRGREWSGGLRRS